MVANLSNNNQIYFIISYYLNQLIYPVHNPAHSAKDSSICLSNSRTSPTEVIANKTKDTATYLSHGLKNTFMYSGIISNYITEVTNCGGLDHPWSIRAQPGEAGHSLNKIFFHSLTHSLTHS